MRSPAILNYADGCVGQQAASAGGGELATARLVIWSPKLGEELDCPLDGITWLDRHLLSAGDDPTLHRSPRCAGVRFVDHGWEMFSHDTSHEVYVASVGKVASVGSVGNTAKEACLDHEQVRAAATHVLPTARGGLQPYPLRLGCGSWLVSVGKWVLMLDVDGPDSRSGSPATADKGTATQERRSRANEPGVRGRRARPLADAVPRVRSYFERKTTARMAIAYYYQEFIVGAVGPQTVPMIEVAVALDLTGDAAVSEYKKELQRLTWNEQGHQRELAEFLIASGLISKADVELASKIAFDNERNGKTKAARARLRYRQKKHHQLKGAALGRDPGGAAGDPDLPVSVR